MNIISQRLTISIKKKNLKGLGKVRNFSPTGLCGADSWKYVKAYVGIIFYTEYMISPKCSYQIIYLFIDCENTEMYATNTYSTFTST